MLPVITNNRATINFMLHVNGKGVQMLLFAMYIAVNFCRSRDKSIPLRQCEQTMQLYLLNICSFAADSQQAHVIDEFCILYNNARHGPSVSS